MGRLVLHRPRREVRADPQIPQAAPERDLDADAATAQPRRVHEGVRREVGGGEDLPGTWAALLEAVAAGLELRKADDELIAPVERDPPDFLRRRRAALDGVRAGRKSEARR